MPVDSDLVYTIGAQIMSAHLKDFPDPSAVPDAWLARLADLSVKAAIAMHEAFARYEGAASG